MLSSLASMPPCSLVRCAEGGEEEGKTALIDQRAVAAGKNLGEIYCQMAASCKF